MPTTVDQVRLIDFTDAEPQTGMGFNSQTLVFPGTALGFTPGAPDPSESGQVVNGHALIVNSHEELMDRIGVSVAASGRYGFVSASAKVDFSRSTGFNSTSTFVLAQASVRNPMVRGVNFHVIPPADALLRAQDLDGFKTAFGDSFVRGIKSGGEFFAVFRLSALRQETQQSLAATLAGEVNGLFVAGSFHAAFTTASQSESDRAEVEVSFYQAAGSGPTASITLDVNDILARLKNFPTVALDHPFPFKAEIATYDTIPIPIPTPIEREDFLFSMQQDEEKKLDYIKRKNDVDFAVKFSEYFVDLPPADQLQVESGIYTQLINAVMRHQVQLAKGQLPEPQAFDPATVHLTEPAPRHFKRKVAVDAPAPAGNLGYIRGNANFTVFDLDQSRAVKVFNFNEPGLNLTDLAITRDRKTVYLSTNKSLKVFDTTANQFAQDIPIASAGLAIAPDGKQLYAAGRIEGDSGTVHVIDTLTNRITRSIAPNVPAGLGFALSPDGKRLYCPNGPGFSVIDADTGNLLFQTTAPADLDLQGASKIRISPDGKRAYVVGSVEEPSGVIVDTDTNRMIGRIGSSGGLVDIAFAPSGARGYMLDNDGAAVRIISIESNMTVKEFTTSLEFAQGIAMHPDGLHCYVLSSVGLLEISTESNSIVRQIPNADSAAAVFSFGPASH